MSDDQQPTAAPQTGVKRGLPSWSLKLAESDAEKLWEVARGGAVHPNAFATQIGLSKASGGSWAQHLALVRVFGLVKATKESVQLTQIGLDIVQTWDAEKRESARRKSFFKCKAYEALVNSYDGNELPGRAQIASRLQYEYGKTPEKADEAADAFIESLKHAGLLSSDDVVRKAGAGSAPTVKVEPPVVSDEDGVDLDDLGEDEFEDDDQSPVEETPEGDDLATFVGGAPITPPGISLAVSLDLSHYRADEVIQILSALGLTHGSRD